MSHTTRDYFPDLVHRHKLGECLARKAGYVTCILANLIVDTIITLERNSEERYEITRLSVGRKVKLRKLSDNRTVTLDEETFVYKIIPQSVS